MIFSIFFFLFGIFYKLKKRSFFFFFVSKILGDFYIFKISKWFFRILYLKLRTCNFYKCQRLENSTKSSNAKFILKIISYIFIFLFPHFFNPSKKNLNVVDFIEKVRENSKNSIFIYKFSANENLSLK